jgi:hypothetical protein
VFEFHCKLEAKRKLFFIHINCEPVFFSYVRFSQDYHDDIRQEQMWEMQALSTTNQNGDNNDLLSGTSDPNDDQDSCSNHFVNDCDMPTTASTPTVAVGPAPNHHHSSLTMDESQCGTTKPTTNSVHQHTQHPHLQQQQQQQQQIHHQHHIGNGEFCFAANRHVDWQSFCDGFPICI